MDTWTDVEMVHPEAYLWWWVARNERVPRQEMIIPSNFSPQESNRVEFNEKLYLRPVLLKMPKKRRREGGIYSSRQETRTIKIPSQINIPCLCSVVQITHKQPKDLSFAIKNSSISHQTFFSSPHLPSPPDLQIGSTLSPGKYHIKIVKTEIHFSRKLTLIHLICPPNGTHRFRQWVDGLKTRCFCLFSRW